MVGRSGNSGPVSVPVRSGSQSSRSRSIRKGKHLGLLVVLVPILLVTAVAVVGAGLGGAAYLRKLTPGVQLDYDYGAIYEKVAAPFALRLTPPNAPDGKEGQKEPAFTLSSVVAADGEAAVFSDAPTWASANTSANAADSPSAPKSTPVSARQSRGYNLDVRFSPAGTEIRLAAIQPARSVVLAEWAGIRLSITQAGSELSTFTTPDVPGAAGAGVKIQAGYAVGADGGPARYSGGLQAEMDVIPRLVTISGQFNLVDVDALAGSPPQRAAKAGVSGELSLSPRARVKAGYEVAKVLPNGQMGKASAPPAVGGGEAGAGADSSSDSSQGGNSNGVTGGPNGASGGLISSTSVGVGYELTDNVSIAANYRLINFAGGENEKPRAGQEASAELLVKF